MKQTPLRDTHVALGARMVEFGGWDMPVQYSGGILEEHAATRNAVGLFDICHMGEYRFEGPDVRSALNTFLTGDFTAVQDGRARYTFLTDDEGGVIDDAVVMLWSDTLAWMIVNAGHEEEKISWIRAHCPDSVAFTDISAGTAKLDVQGPNTSQVIQALLDMDFRTMPFYSFRETEWSGQSVVISRSGYTGEPGVELYIDITAVQMLWDALLNAGEPHGIRPCGLGARDTLRLEAGLPLYGHEMSRQRSMLQAGFGRFVSFDKPQAFPGKDALQTQADRLAANDPSLPVLVGLTVNDKRVPREGFAVWNGEMEIGVITSGAPAPTLGTPIAFAYVAPDCAAPGTPVEIQIRKHRVPATVTKLPFYSTPALRKRIDA